LSSEKPIHNYPGRGLMCFSVGGGGGGIDHERGGGVDIDRDSDLSWTS
jgi:hypothetical protein